MVCPLTDPDVSNYTLKMCDRPWLPKGMELVPDPHKGILIKTVQRSFKGCYRCSVQKNGSEIMSEPISLNVRGGKPF